MTRFQVAVTKGQICRLNAFVLVGVLFILASVAYAERTNLPEERNFGMALPGGKCRVSPLLKWTKPEKWAWTQICEGQIANFNKCSNNEELDPRNPDHDDKWSDNRKLRSRFLETILLHEPFRSAIPRRGVRISGAYFPNCIDLRDASIERPLRLAQSRFKSQVDMSRLRTPTFISLEGSKFDKELNMNSASVGGHLFMRRAEFDEVDLIEAKIGDQLDVEGAAFKEKLDMDSVSTGSSLLMKDAEFNEVVLRGAKISGQLSMVRSTFTGKLDMETVSTGDSLLMKNAEFNEVVLRGAKIGDQLSMVGSTFTGKLNMETVSVSLDLFMREADFGSPANLIFLSIGSSLDAWGATLRGLDLTGSKIKGELRLGAANRTDIEWKGYTDDNGDCQAPKLTLRNTSVGALQDTTGIWPDHLEREFEGFTYDRLGGFGASEQEKPNERGSSWFIKWLEKDGSYSPQPYRHLAGVLRAAGYEDMADDILVASRDRELGESNPLQFKWWRLWMLNIFIGYGYGWRIFWALAWVAGLAVLGAAILRIAKESNRRSMKLGFLYSLDMLLPIIHLREWHYTDVDLNTWAKYYFYIHKIMGYVLIFFVLAGLSGLTEE